MSNIEPFKSFIWDFYHKNKRDFAWRNIDNSYYVVVSEIMLQQTQTHRVVSKYEEFLEVFPTLQSLADASLREVLSVWQGLGYYRRARYLHQIAKIVINDYAGNIPQDPKILETFPGIGVATAASICAFAFNIPTVFIETNIRTVFIHHFFSEQAIVADKELLPFIADTLDKQNSREWYYALMDYGVWLKNQYKNPSRRSAHYGKQTTFEGSDRQIRAAILKLITEKGTINREELFSVIKKDEQLMKTIVRQLENEQFITTYENNAYTIADN